MSSQTILNFTEIKDVKPGRNPELEKLRNDILDASYFDEEKNAKDLANDLKSIHAAYLFDICGKSALAKICEVISSTPKCSSLATSSSWKDLASELGLNFHKIGCIENKNTNSSDYTETVLMWYAQKEDATLDRIVLALNKLKRYDAIALAKTHLKAIEKFARREQFARTEEDESYSIVALESEVPTHDGILRPSGRRFLLHQLPITLRNFDFTKSDELIIENKVEDNHQQAIRMTRAPRPRRKWSKVVMLTYAKDGEKAADRVALQLRRQRGRYLPIGVIILEEQIDLVQANPEYFITHYFSKVDFIIPIITPGYLESLRKDPDPMDTMSAAIDTRYVKFIFTLMYNYYVGNSCKNDKFRSIIPDELLNDVLTDELFKGHIILQAFVPESQLDRLALRMLKKKRRS